MDSQQFMSSEQPAKATLSENTDQSKDIPARDFRTYDYFKVTASEDQLSRCIDNYECFGWILDEHVSSVKNSGKSTLHFKRIRHIMNKTELTRLQRHFESCMNEIKDLQDSVRSSASAVSMTCALAGCACVAGSVFAGIADPPYLAVSLILGAAGFLLWIGAWYGYRLVTRIRRKKILPLIEEKYNEADEVLEKAGRLLC